MKAQQPIVAVLVFAGVYAAVIEATNWIAVYLMDWWDQKFGNQSGNIAFGHEIMLLFVAASVLSFSVAVAVHRRWIRTAPENVVAWSSAASAVLAHSAEFLAGLIFRDTQAGEPMLLGLGLLLGGPALFGSIMFKLARHRMKQQANI